MRDGPVRRAVKKVVLGGYHIRHALHRNAAHAAGQVRYELGGACVRSGQCCEAPGIRVGKVTFYVPLLRRAFLWWHEAVNGFALQSVERASRVFYFRCSHYDRENRRCDSYDSRPGMCRSYPLLLTEQTSPEPLERCGFKLLDLKRKEMLGAIERSGVSADQMAKLKEGLNLE